MENALFLKKMLNDLDLCTMSVSKKQKGMENLEIRKFGITLTCDKQIEILDYLKIVS